MSVALVVWWSTGSRSSGDGWAAAVKEMIPPDNGHAWIWSLTVRHDGADVGPIIGTAPTEKAARAAVVKRLRKLGLVSSPQRRR